MQQKIQLKGNLIYTESVSRADHISWSPGKPFPLGALRLDSGVNFALYAPDQKEVTLALFSPGKEQPNTLIHLNPNLHFTNGVWHVHVKSVPKDGGYAYQIGKNWVIDPYAKELCGNHIWKKRNDFRLAKLPREIAFDWEGVKKPGYSIEELFIYEMHVRGFTQDRSSRVQNHGTFLGVIEKIPHLLDLGINAVELMPIFSFDETLHSHSDLCNYWGYSSEHFFALMPPYGTADEFKQMVKALHKAGIEVILDVVYNHVGTGWYDTLAKSTYFILDEKGNHTNYTGCGNTVNSNHPQVMKLILASLRYFANEMQVDGFRFDLATILCRGGSGAPMEHPPIIEAMCKDPLLKKVKLIAEPWDCANLYLVGSFPRSDRFAQWNGEFRDSVRRFIKGTDGAAGSFARSLSGSHHFQSINFITAHDGFTLCDLVTYNEKHNEKNGEKNRDGNSWNESWNCGTEGKTENPEIRALRIKQMKNFILALCFSAGTPMMLMGDEYGHTRKGNNNAYCQDNKLNYFLWNELRHSSEIFSFFKKCIALRKSCKILLKQKALDEHSITWYETHWDSHSRRVSYILHDKNRDFFLSFNAHYEGTHLNLPKRKNWRLIIDTALPNASEVQLDHHYFQAPYSSVLILS